jgi:predicted CxxxxCH...CXXCH cytochrome family protein
VLAILGCQPTTLSDGMTQDITCSSCHGSSDNAAPPTAVDGSKATSHVGVGAHQAHVREGTIAAATPCTECHPVPDTVQDGHHPARKGRPAEVVPGSLSSRGGAKPVWDRTTLLCTNTYCHGATLDGAATRPAPLWTKVDGTQKTCTSCHGNPPGGRHPAENTCEVCHADVVGPGGVIKAPRLHVDGQVQASSHGPGYADPDRHGSDFNQGKADCKLCHGPDLSGTPGITGCDTCHTPGWRTDCVFCHGGAADRSGSPPLGLSGAVATSDPGVGAHPAHQIAGRVGRAVACTECHAVPTDVLTPGHVDVPPADVTFGSLARNGGAQPAWDRTSQRCQNTYCHGATLSGAATRSAPLWTRVDATQLACTSCHGFPVGLSTSHAAHLSLPMDCSECHGAVVSITGAFVNLDLHVNGSVSVAFATGTWTQATRTCSATGSACHGPGGIAW